MPIDEMAREDPDVIERYYGVVDGNFQGDHNHNQVEDGSEGVETLSDEEPLARSHDTRSRVLCHQRRSVRHEAIPTPRNESPFESVQQEEEFKTKLERIQIQGTVPDSYNLTRRELGNKPYPNMESLPGRMCGSRELNIILPPEVWRPRALIWAQALGTVTEILKDAEFVGFG